MIRKQVYISKRQQQLLNRLARKRKMSEAMLIREAIDHQIQNAGTSSTPNVQAWERAHALMNSLHAQGPLPNRPRQWTCDELYAERTY